MRIWKLATLLFTAFCLNLALASSGSAQDFCWRDSKGRGVGEIPNSCPDGQEMVGLLCYDRCPAGMKRAGIDCHSQCPAGMRDDGLYCRLSEYGRGAGYPWKFGDGLNDNGMKSRCQNSEGQGNCEKCGAIFYPKCQPGYEPSGCNICRPKRPDCGALGLGNQIDLSCEKKIKIASEPKTGTCASDEEKDAGLCYKKCDSGYKGVGPVCWGQPPTNWSECGMGAAKDTKTCATTVFSQVTSVAQLASTVASLGSSTAANAGNNAGKAGRLAELQAKFNELKQAFEKIKNTDAMKVAITGFQAANSARKGYIALEHLDAAVTEEDIARASAEIAALLDPSGVASVIAAYTYPKCSKYFPGLNNTPLPTEPAAGMRWKAGPSIPANAVVGGYDGPRNMTMQVCRAEYGGAKHPGKLYGSYCAIPYGGRQISLNNFEVLVNDTDTLAWTAGPSIPSNAVVGGVENGTSLQVCRAFYDNGVHPGKVWSGKCWIGYGDRDMAFDSFEVLTLVPAGPTWVGGSNAPSDAVIAGFDGATPLLVCRASYAGSMHPGETWQGNCDIGYGGGVVVLSSFEVLKMAGAKLSWIAGPNMPANAIIAGQQGGFQMGVCRATLNGVVHSGKVWGKNCNIGAYGAEQLTSTFEVLVKN